jgi:branched-chain amino acid transport system permease protein
VNGYSGDARLRWSEGLPWLAALAAFFAFPDLLSLGARVEIFILFALSLDLILGYAGIITLGHSAFFGVGAYAAGLASVRLGVNEPFSQLALAALAAAIVGAVTGAVVLRTRGLTLLMLTLAITSLLFELANRAGGLTGGADGLSGITVAPVVGLFKFDLFGTTAYLYCLFVLFAGWFLVRRVVHAPFGAMLTGIRENRARMAAIGAPVTQRLVMAYTLSAALAGVAGALNTQVNAFVGLNVFGFELSGDVLIMLILGGAGRIYGAFVGPVVYLLAQDQLSKAAPELWYLGIGVLLIGVVLFARGGILGIVDRVAAWRR